MNKYYRELFSDIVEKDLLKKDSIFVLNDGRLIYCRSHENPKNAIRTSRKTGNIEINFTRFKQFDKKFQYWFLCFGFYGYKYWGDYSAVDLAASKEYVKKYGIKKLFTSYIEMVRHSPTELNRTRLKTLQMLIKK